MWWLWGAEQSRWSDGEESAAEGAGKGRQEKRPRREPQQHRWVAGTENPGRANIQRESQGEKLDCSSLKIANKATTGSKHVSEWEG